MKTKKFDIADYLKDDTSICLFLKDVSATGTANEFIHAVGIVARAKGMNKIAEEISVSRTSLYKSLSKQGNPAFETIFDTLKACGLTLSVEIHQDD